MLMREDDENVTFDRKLMVEMGHKIDAKCIDLGVILVAQLIGFISS